MFKKKKKKKKKGKGKAIIKLWKNFPRPQTWMTLHALRSTIPFNLTSTMHAPLPHKAEGHKDAVWILNTGSI